jgi:hypothetical protein
MTARRFSNAKIEWNGDIASVVYPSWLEWLAVLVI